MEFIQKQLKRIEDLLESQQILKKEFLTLEETSSYLKFSKSTIYKLTGKKEIPFYVPGGKKIFFRRSEIDAWILRSKVSSASDFEQDVDEYLSRTLKS